MHPRSPYAVSKAAAHWTTVNYRESYGIFACCGVLFNHESFLRDPSFFVKKVIIEALECAEGKRQKIAVGNLDVRRDFGYSPSYVKAMHLMMAAPRPDDYLICSGRSTSLRDVLDHVLTAVGLDWGRVEVDPKLFRPAEIYDIYGDCTKARRDLGWHYDLDFFGVLDILIAEERAAKSHR
jgi:GDPmannose 4,6-dehydratase